MNVPPRDPAVAFRRIGDDQPRTSMPKDGRLSLVLLVVLQALVSAPQVAAAQVTARNAPRAFAPPRAYVCYRAGAESRRAPIVIDGRMDEACWRAAPWTTDFVDIEGDAKPRPRYRTRAKMLWDDQFFYIATLLEEPHVWATLTTRDSVIFHDNDFEVFFDPDGDNHNYGEFEINALNTGWDLRLPKPYKDGGQADDAWEIVGLKTAVHVSGTLNDPSDTDRGWSIEIAIPWSVLDSLADPLAPVRTARRDGSVFQSYGPARPVASRGTHDGQQSKQSRQAVRQSQRRPSDGEQWRVNFSRVQWQHEIRDGKYRRVPDRSENNWVWSPQGVVNMHRPETWGRVQFSSVPVGQGAVQVRSDPAGPAKYLLHRIYYAQHAYQKQHDRYATDLTELGLDDLSAYRLTGPPRLSVSDNRFTASVEFKPGRKQPERWWIRDDARIWREPRTADE